MCESCTCATLPRLSYSLKQLFARNAELFARRLAAGRESRRVGDLAGAASSLESALRLWQGVALDGVRSLASVRDVILRARASTPPQGS